MQRDKIIVRTSVIGILANVFLAGFKAVVGAVSGSIAVILDAVNNLSDALSSVITIVGTKLAGRKPDRKHPYGYGRVEYLTAVLVSVIVLYVGVTSLIESIKKIIRPETPDYSPVALIIIAVAVLVKIVLGRHVKGDAAARLREDVRRAVMAHEHALQMHGFCIDEASEGDPLRRGGRLRRAGPRRRVPGDRLPRRGAGPRLRRRHDAGRGRE